MRFASSQAGRLFVIVAPVLSFLNNIVNGFDSVGIIYVVYQSFFRYPIYLCDPAVKIPDLFS